MDVPNADPKDPPPEFEAQLAPATEDLRVVSFGSMRGQIHFTPCWDDPIDLDSFLSGEF